MSIESTLYSTLTNDADVSGIVGTRVYPGIAPPAAAQTTPYIVYTVIFATHPQTFSGRSTLKNARVQVDSYGTTYAAVRSLADHIYDAVDTGMSIGRSDEQQFYEDETELHRIMIDFSLWG